MPIFSSWPIGIAKLVFPYAQQLGSCCTTVELKEIAIYNRTLNQVTNRSKQNYLLADKGKTMLILVPKTISDTSDSSCQKCFANTLALGRLRASLPPLATSTTTYLYLNYNCLELVEKYKFTHTIRKDGGHCQVNCIIAYRTIATRDISHICQLQM